MIVTKEHQEQLIENYKKEGKTFNEVTSFIAGMDAMFKYIKEGISIK
jgi:hypothetical protein